MPFILNTEKLTKIGWLIAVFVIGIPVLILIFNLVDMYKNSTGYETTEVKLAKSRSNVNVLTSALKEKEESAKQVAKVKDTTIDVLTEHVKDYNELETKRIKINQAVENTAYKYKKKVSITTDDNNLLATPTSKKVIKTNTTAKKTFIKVDKIAYESMGEENIDSIYDMYEAVKEIK